MVLQSPKTPELQKILTRPSIYDHIILLVVPLVTLECINFLDEMYESLSIDLDIHALICTLGWPLFLNFQIV